MRWWYGRIGIGSGDGGRGTIPRVSRGILLVAAMLLAACADSGTAPTEPDPWFPLAQGATWTYAPVDELFGEPFRWRVTDVAGDTVVLDRPAGASHPGPVILIDGGDAIDLVLPGGDVGTFYRFGRDDPWVHRDPWECDDGSTWLVVPEDDPVVTPAGTFRETIRVERRSTANCTDAGTMMEWWAPGVGLVRWEELNAYARGPLVFELTNWSGQGS